MRWYAKLHWQIIIGLICGLIFGVLASVAGWVEFTEDWVSPFGDIFLNLLKLIAVPLILASLVTGVASLSDLRKLSRIGGKTIGIYMGTTLVAIVIGLLVVNTLKPGRSVPADMRTSLQESFEGQAEAGSALAETAKERSPLQLLVDIVPGNFLNSASDNANMLQVVFVALFFGIGLLLIPREKATPLIVFFDSLNALVIKLVELIMYLAPVGVFALLADAITSIASDSPAQILELLGALGYYAIAVLLGLLLQTSVVYMVILKTFTGVRIRSFIPAIAPAQLVAFSTSSSGATLPVTMECVEKNVGVSEEVSSFVLPLGATINMDGTALYQAVAAVFIAQTLGLGLDLTAQLTIVLTALLASIGTAGVPSAGIVMLVIILESVGIPGAGIALILGVDRILDMCRTVTNVTGDAVVATVVASGEGQLNPPAPGVMVQPVMLGNTEV